MTALVIAEHDHKQLKGGTANAVTAAAKMGGDVHVLVAGTNTKPVAEAASKLAGVSKVLHVEAAHYDGGIAENYAALVSALAKGYSHVRMPRRGSRARGACASPSTASARSRWRAASRCRWPRA